MTLVMFLQAVTNNQKKKSPNEPITSDFEQEKLLHQHVEEDDCYLIISWMFKSEFQFFSIPGTWPIPTTPTTTAGIYFLGSAEKERWKRNTSVK